MSALSQFMEDRRLNTVLSWLLILFFAAVAIESLLDGDIIWAGFSGVVAVLAVVPVYTYRDMSVMVPWEVLFLAAVPMIGQAFDLAVLTSPVMTYLAVATVALMLIVELHLFTAVEMTHRFAVTLVVIATLAAAGIWAVVQWFADVYLGTQYLSTNAALMYDFLAATITGIVAGVVFDAYFRRRRDDQLRDVLEVDIV